MTGMTFGETLAGIASCGREPLDNMLISGRMPPDDTCGLHPAAGDGLPGYHTCYFGDNTICALLKEQLPKPLPSLDRQFAAAAPSTAPGSGPVFDPKGAAT